MTYNITVVGDGKGARVVKYENNFECMSFMTPVTKEDRRVVRRCEGLAKVLDASGDCEVKIKIRCTPKR